jgi:hypothetical protein
MGEEGDADRIGGAGEALDRGDVRRQRAHRGLVGELDDPPVRAVVDQHGGQRAELQAVEHARPGLLVRRQLHRAADRRAHEDAPLGAFALDADRQQAGAAFLHQVAVLRLAQAASSAACALPTLGWPAKGSSWRGVKMRTR